MVWRAFGEEEKFCCNTLSLPAHYKITRIGFGRGFTDWCVSL